MPPNYTARSGWLAGGRRSLWTCRWAPATPPS